MDSPILEQISEVLSKAWLAKSRTTNRLTEREQKKLLAKLEEILMPLLVADMEEEVPDMEINEAEPAWYGLDKANDLEIAGDKREEIVEAWAAETGADLETLLHTQVGKGMYFYTFPRIEEPNLELWVVTAENREQMAALLEAAKKRNGRGQTMGECSRPFPCLNSCPDIAHEKEKQNNVHSVPLHRSRTIRCGLQQRRYCMVCMVNKFGDSRTYGVERSVHTAIPAIRSRTTYSQGMAAR